MQVSVTSLCYLQPHVLLAPHSYSVLSVPRHSRALYCCVPGPAFPSPHYRTYSYLFFTSLSVLIENIVFKYFNCVLPAFPWTSLCGSFLSCCDTPRDSQVFWADRPFICFEVNVRQHVQALCSASRPRWDFLHGFSPRCPGCVASVVRARLCHVSLFLQEWRCSGSLMIVSWGIMETPEWHHYNSYLVRTQKASFCLFLRIDEDSKPMHRFKKYISFLFFRCYFFSFTVVRLWERGPKSWCNLLKNYY